MKLLCVRARPPSCLSAALQASRSAAAACRRAADHACEKTAARTARPGHRREACRSRRRAARCRERHRCRAGDRRHGSPCGAVAGWKSPAMPDLLIVPIAVRRAALAQAKTDQHAPPGEAKRARGKQPRRIVEFALAIEPERKRMRLRQRRRRAVHQQASAAITSAPMRG